MNEVRLIDANAVDVSQTVKGISDFAECIRDAVQTTLDNAPTVDAIEIPKNVTNGDMIKIMFPYIEIEGIGGEIKCIAAQIGFGTSYFALDWWNEQFNRGGEE